MTFMMLSAVSSASACYCVLFLISPLPKHHLTVVVYELSHYLYELSHYLTWDNGQYYMKPGSTNLSAH